jgi:hypothetical protein
MDNLEYCEINSDITLNYITQILMEERADENISAYKHHHALQAMEKPFYDILGKAYPSSPKQTMVNSGSQSGLPDDINNSHHDLERSGNSVSDLLRGRKGVHSIGIDGGSELCDVALQFNRIAEEAKKFVPSIGNLVVDPESNDLSSSKEANGSAIGQHSNQTNKIRSYPHVDLKLVEGRNSKYSAISTSEIIRNELFDRVLLSDEQYLCDVAHLREMAKEANINLQYVQNTGSAQGKQKPQSKKQEKEAVDLRGLLIQCAQAISSNNHPFASELLKKIRHHSSPYGDGSQRLAVYFADALEARAAGTGSQINQRLVVKRTSVTDMLKAYRLSIAACPFGRVAYYFANKTIVDVLGSRPRVHIIDFGIMFAFQWPSLIQRLAKREGGPPQLRITGIDVPETGFRPCKQIEETGKRLAEYARMFNVPFQYQSVASRWESIYIADLNIGRDEVLIVNCLHKMKNLGDETEDIDSARDRVLRIMKRMNPDVLITGVMNGLHSSPFFLPRFREALFFYSSQFDMLNSTVVHQNHEARIMIERDLLGADVFNVVACEGAERIERPESYKQWQARILKAGFKKLPVDQTILKSSVDRKELYHGDFVIDEDSGWLLQGWKGRIMHALSSWKPKDS